MAESVGTVHLSISADLDTLGAQLRSKLGALGKELGRQLGKDLGQETSTRFTAEMDATTAKLKQQMSAVGKDVGKNLGDDMGRAAARGLEDKLATASEKVYRPLQEQSAKAGRAISNNLTPKIDTAKANSDLDKLAAQKRNIQVQLDLNSRRAQQQLDELTARQGDLQVRIDLDTARARIKLDELDNQIKSLDEYVTVNADDTAARAKLDALRAQREVVELQVQANTASARAEIERIAGRKETVEIEVKAKTDRAREAIAAIDAEMSKPRSLDLFGNAGKGLTALQSGISSITSGFSTLGLAGVASLGVIIPVAVAAAGAVLSLGATFTGLLGAIGVVKLGFMGIGTAITALDAQQSKAAESAAAAQTSAVSLANAYDSLKSARQGVADAEHQAGLATQQAADQTAQAEQSLRAAQADELQTQKDLNAAREQAILDLEDMANRAADAALNQRQAALDLTDAEANYQKVLANPKSTQAQKDRAQLQLDQATQRKREADEEAKRTADDAAKARKAGVEGSNAVTQAKQREKSAVDKVHQAEQNVAKARANEAEVARRNAESIAKAEQGVVQAQRGIQAALVATQQVGSATRNAVNEAFANLTPAGRHFAKFIFGLKGDLDVLQRAAQSALLPPLEKAIKILLPYLPQVTAFVSSVGSAIGDVAIKIAKMFVSKDFKEFFATVAKDTPGAIRTLGDMFVSLGHVIIRIFNAAEPYAKTFLGNIASFFKHLDEETSGKKGESKLKRLFEGVMPTLGAAWNVISAIGRVLGSIVKGASGGEGGNKSAADVLNGIASAINRLATYLDRHPEMVQDLMHISVALLALKAANPVIGTIGSIGQALGGMASVLNLFKEGGFIAGLFAEGGLLGSGGLMVTGLEAVGVAIAAITAPAWIIIGVLVAVGVGFYLLYTKCQWFHDVVNLIIHKIGDFFVWLWNNAVKPSLLAIEAAFWWLYNNVIQPVWQLIYTAIQVAWGIMEVIFGTIEIALKIIGLAWSYAWDHWLRPIWDWIWGHVSDVWNKHLKPIFDTVGSYIGEHVAPVFQKAVSALGDIWSGLLEAFKTPIRWVIQTVLDDGLFAAYNWVAKKFGVKPDNVHVDVPSVLQPGSSPGGGGHSVSKSSHVRAVATGGSIIGPGTGTSDSIPALLSNGEHVWTAREVRAAGGHDAVEAMRAAVLRKAGAPAFASGGGVWGWIVDKSKSVAGKIGGWLGDFKDFITDPVGSFKKLANNALGGLPGGKDGLIGNVLTGAVNKTVGGVIDFVKGFIGLGGGGDGSGPVGSAPAGAGVERWRPMVLQALATQGLSAGLANRVLTQIQTESGGNPNALQMVHDVNWPNNRARGLMQVIPPTFARWHWPGTSDNEYDPWANIMAALNYAKHTYGPDLGFLGQGHGYDNGGWLMPGTQLVHNDTGKPEAVFSPSQWATLEDNLLGGGGGDFSKTTNIDVATYGDPHAIAAAIAAEQGRAELLDAISL